MFDPHGLMAEELDRLALVGGIDTVQGCSCCTILYSGERSSFLPDLPEGIELLPLEDALERNSEVRDHFCFGLVAPNENELAQSLARTHSKGYFLRVRKGVKVEAPLHAGIIVPGAGFCLDLHTVIVLEEGAQLTLITGCTAGSHDCNGTHRALSEIYIGPRARLHNIMIHNWAEGYEVTPFERTVLEDNAHYEASYYSLVPPRSLKRIPHYILKGHSSSARDLSVIASLKGTFCETGADIDLKGENSSAELISRTANYGGNIIQKGLLTGAAANARGHVDCSGLMLGNKGTISAIPGLKTLHSDARLSHEAAIGRIDRGKVRYLQSRGLDEASAIRLIVHGFLELDKLTTILGSSMASQFADIEELSGHGE